VRGLRRDAPTRGVTEIVPGDFVLIGRTWKQVDLNSAAGADRTPRSWRIRTTDGGVYGMYDVNRYAKAEDLE
jgi:hypothetical protein